MLRALDIGRLWAKVRERKQEYKRHSGKRSESVGGQGFESQPVAICKLCPVTVLICYPKNTFFALFTNPIML